MINTEIIYRAAIVMSCNNGLYQLAYRTNHDELNNAYDAWSEQTCIYPYVVDKDKYQHIHDNPKKYGYFNHLELYSALNHEIIKVQENSNHDYLILLKYERKVD